MAQTANITYAPAVANVSESVLIMVKISTAIVSITDKTIHPMSLEPPSLLEVVFEEFSVVFSILYSALVALF